MRCHDKKKVGNREVLRDELSEGEWVHITVSEEEMGGWSIGV